MTTPAFPSPTQAPPSHRADPHAARSLRKPAFVLGFALGGLFDGILLHQILQWHHLLSGLDVGDRDLRFLIMADGIFHAVTYVLVLVGLAGLWRYRAGLVVAGSTRLLAGALLIGFGTWHLLDGVLSHWVLGLHRIRMDSDHPLFWDLVWAVGFGLVPLLAGLAIIRRPGKDAAGPMAALILAAGAVIAGFVSLLPPEGREGVSVVFHPEATQTDIFAAAVAMDASVGADDASGTVWTFYLPEGRSPLGLYRHGAIFVGGAGPAACLGWLEPAQAEAVNSPP